MPSKQSGEKPLHPSLGALPHYAENTNREIRVVNNGSFVAVYVIGPKDQKGEGPVKIGMARKPDSRLATLQTGIWMRLALLEIRWVKSQALARKVEQEAHKLLAAAGKAMMGEWFDVTPDKALEAVQWAALTVGADLIDDGDMRVVPYPEQPIVYRTVNMHLLTEEEKALASRARQYRRLKKAGQL